MRHAVILLSLAFVGQAQARPLPPRVSPCAGSRCPAPVSVLSIPVLAPAVRRDVPLTLPPVMAADDCVGGT